MWDGFGWLVRDLGRGESNWWHTGAFAGTYGLVVRAANGYAWAVFMNSWPANHEQFDGVVDASLWDAFHQVTRWPRHDLFPQFQ